MITTAMAMYLNTAFDANFEYVATAMFDFMCIALIGGEKVIKNYIQKEK